MLRRRAVPEIVASSNDLGVGVPLIGDFHYNGHQLLARVSRQLRRGPGEVPDQPGQRRCQAPRRALPDDHPRSRSSNDRPVRIGVNWGSLDQALLTELMDENARIGEAALTRAT